MNFSGGDVIQWQGECGEHHVGEIALVYERHACSRPREFAMCVAGPYCYLIRHWPTGELEWVPESKLMPYPSEPIPEPTK